MKCLIRVGPTDYPIPKSKHFEHYRKNSPSVVNFKILVQGKKRLLIFTDGMADRLWLDVTKNFT